MKQNIMDDMMEKIKIKNPSLTSFSIDSDNINYYQFLDYLRVNLNLSLTEPTKCTEIAYVKDEKGNKFTCYKSTNEYILVNNDMHLFLQTVNTYKIRKNEEDSNKDEGDIRITNIEIYHCNSFNTLNLMTKIDKFILSKLI